MEHEPQNPTPTNEQPTTQPPVTTPDSALLMGILCYLGILLIIPYLMERDNPFVKFHLKQGIVLLGIWLIAYVVKMTIMTHLLWSIMNLVDLGILVLAIVGIVHVVQKKELPLPLVGGFADKVHI